MGSQTRHWLLVTLLLVLLAEPCMSQVNSAVGIANNSAQITLSPEGQQRIKSFAGLVERIPGMEPVQNLLQTRPVFAQAFLQGVKDTQIMTMFNSLFNAQSDIDVINQQGFIELAKNKPPLKSCDSATVLKLMVATVLVLTFVGIGLHQLRHSTSKENDLFDFDKFPIAVQQWEEWEGKPVKKRGLGADKHYITLAELRSGITTHLGKRGLHITSEEAEEIISLLPAESQVSSQQNAERILSLVQPSSQMDGLLKDIQLVTSATMINLIGQGAWKEWAPECSQCRECSAASMSVAFVNRVFALIQLEHGATLEKKHLDQLTELETKLQKLIEIGQLSEPMATVDVVNSAGTTADLDPTLINTIKYIYLRDSHQTSQPNPRSTTGTTGYHTSWENLKCAFASITFIKELATKARAKANYKSAFPEPYYQRPSDVIKSPFETPELALRANKHLPRFDSFAMLLVVIMFSMIALCVLLSLTMVPGINHKDFDTCNPEEFELPEVTCTVSSTEATVSWPQLLPCQQNLIEELQLHEDNNDFDPLHVDASMSSLRISGLHANSQYRVRLVAKVKGETKIKLGPMLEINTVV